MPGPRPLALLAAAALAALACAPAPTPADEASHAAGPSPTPAGPPPAVQASPAPAPRPPPRSVAAASEGAVDEIVRHATISAGDARLLVYVGAEWCEPCVAFHDALARGDLAGRLDGVVFLEFDLDRDGARLQGAGYQSRYVPLFALPAADGRASGRQIEGGIKGPGAVDNLVGRLTPLLGG